MINRRTAAAVLAAMSLALMVVPAVWAEGEGDMSLEKVLEGYYEALGGLDALNEIDTVRMTGKMSMQGGAMEAPFTMTFLRPDKARLEFTFQGMTGIQAYDGESAWFVMPFMGKTEPEPMPEDQAKMMQEQADFDGPLVAAKEKGIEIELQGKEEIEGTEAYKLKVLLANGEERYYFLDSEYHLPIVVQAKTTMQGQEMEVQTTYGDYKEVAGVMMAHSLESKPKGAPEGSGQMITIDAIETGVDIDASYFAMPEKAAAPAGG